MPIPYPTPSPPDLGPNMFAYGNSDIGWLGFGSLSATPDIATAFQLMSASGMGMPPLRAGDIGRPRDQGEFIGLNLLGGRDVAVDIAVSSIGYVSTWAARQALAYYCNPAVQTESEFYYQPPERGAPLLFCLARCTKMDWPLDIAALRAAPPSLADASAGGVYQAMMNFHATDPRWYEAPVTDTTLTPGGSGTLTNNGTVETRPVIYITGQCTAPAVTNGADTLTFTNPAGPSVGGYDLGPGDSILVDLDSHLIVGTVGGVFSDLANWITTGSTWWTLWPGANTVSFAVGAAGTGPTCLLNWSPAYTSA